MPDFMLVPPEDSIVDNDGNLWSLGETVIHGKALLRNGVQFAGGQGVLLLYLQQQVYTINDLGQWFVAAASGWRTFPGDPRLSLAIGIDVSHWQGNIDWTKVKASGRSFAFIKATESSNVFDGCFADNWNEAKTAGLLRGAYHFYRFAASPQSQVEQFLATVGDDLGELPLVVDVEDIDAQQPNSADVRQFLELVQQRAGQRCLIYTGSWYWNLQRWGRSVPWARDYDLWAADYSGPSPACPSDWPTWKFWQHSNSGEVSGIDGKVDLNFFNGTNADLQAYARHGG